MRAKITLVKFASVATKDGAGKIDKVSRKASNLPFKTNFDAKFNKIPIFYAPKATLNEFL